MESVRKLHGEERGGGMPPLRTDYANMFLTPSQKSIDGTDL